MRFVVLALLGSMFISTSLAQISPGELTSAHARWDGVQHCTACHTLGKSLSNEKCLDCHKEIGRRINFKKGYHATIGNKLCEECHREHHGRQFQIVRFDTVAFDHASVGFRLEGKHTHIGCKACHTPNHITIDDVKDLSSDRTAHTYLGTSSACRSCHEDIHKGQFTQDCSYCHTNDRWKPASRFSHDRSRYPLTGKHIPVDCASCHNTILAGTKAVRYAQMSFISCTECHSDSHKGKFAQQKCSACHTTEDWRRIEKGRFEHAETHFPLRGKHVNVKCDQCHQTNTKVKNASGEFGFHITRFGLCADCHAESHAGQFLTRRDRGACETCHTEESWTVVTFTINDHDSTRFSLRGGHVGVPCGACHAGQQVIAKSTRRFVWTRLPDCTTCHQDIHKGQFKDKMPRGCESCHTVKTWQDLTFSHEKTKFPLNGKHALVVCTKCHTRPKNSAADAPVQYSGIRTECFTCHADEHEGQFGDPSHADCSRCHTEQRWKELRFNHDTQSAFALTGLHARVPCTKCHERVMIHQRSIIHYKPLGTQCTDCHTKKL